MEALMSKAGWASIRLTQAEIWDRILNPGEWADIKAELEKISDLLG